MYIVNYHSSATLLHIVLFLFQLVYFSFGDTKTDQRVTKFSENSLLFSVVFNNNSIYIGGVNKLYQLSASDLTLKELYVYPDVTINSNCININLSSTTTVPVCGNSISKVELLIIDNDHQAIISCGTSNNGFCYKHSQSNITQDIVFLNGPSEFADSIVSSSGSSVGFIGPGPDKKNVFYFARTLDAFMPLNQQQSVSSKRLNDAQNGFEFTYNDIPNNIVSQVSVSRYYAETYKIRYVYGFSYNGFSYFVTNQNKKLQSSKKLQMRIVRVCQDDEAFYSYSELSLRCKINDNNLNYALNASLIHVAKDFMASESELIEFNKSNAMLLILAGEADTLLSVDYSKGTMLCYYEMAKIENYFSEATENCQTQPTYSPGLEFLFNEDDRRICGRGSAKDITSCPNLSRRNSIHYIYVEEAYKGKKLFSEKNGLDEISQNSLFRSIEPFVYGKVTAIALGTSTSSVSLFRIGVNVKYDVYDPIKNFPLNGSAITTIKYSPSTDALIALDSKTLYSIKIPMLCELASTCRQCMFRKFIHCGYCISSHTCTTQDSCESDWTQDSCPPIITSFYPHSGPVQGNTTITIYGEALGHSTPRIVDKVSLTTRKLLIGGTVPCIPSASERYGELQCVTNQSGVELSGDLSLSIYSPRLGQEISYEDYGINGSTITSEAFLFVSVNVSTFSPNFGPEIGGTIITINGQNLNAGSNASVTVASISCVVISRSTRKITCITAPKTSKTVDNLVKVDIDGTEWKLSQQFIYKPNPDVEQARVNTIYRGGTQLHVVGENFKSVSNPHAIITLMGVQKTVECNPIANNVLSFTSPYFPANRTGHGDIKFVMDGYKTTISYIAHKIPSFSQWHTSITPPNHDNQYFVKVKGDNLLTGCSKWDYKVTVGKDIQCSSVKVDTGLLSCQVFTNDISKSKEDISRLEISVYLGTNVTYHPGYLDLSASVSVATISIAVLAVVFAVGIIIGIIFYCRKKAKKPEVREDTVRYTESGRYCPSSISDVKDPLLSPEILQEISGLLIARPLINYSKENELGKGHFGIVYHGELIHRDTEYHEKVAIKTLSRIEDAGDIEAFLKEGLIMSSFKHTHVLTLIGICMENERLPMVILPYMKHGDILRFVRNPDKNPTVKDLVGFGLQACKGMEYLASHRFVHRDLAARNCMLNEEFVVKVADFGLARDVYEKEYYKPHDSAVRMPVKWMALESLQQQKFTTKTDVWSFGIMMWELLTRGVTPYPDVDAFDVVNYILDGRRLRQPEFCPDELYNLMLRCWHPSEEIRPTFKILVIEIEDIFSGIHGVHYPSLDVSYINISGLHPYPSLSRTMESRSTGGSMHPDVFSPSPLINMSPMFETPQSSPVPPPRNMMPLLEDRQTPKSAHTPLPDLDGEGYLIPDTPKNNTARRKPVPLQRSINTSNSTENDYLQPFTNNHSEDHPLIDDKNSTEQEIKIIKNGKKSPKLSGKHLDNETYLDTPLIFEKMTSC